MDVNFTYLFPAADKCRCSLDVYAAVHDNDRVEIKRCRLSIRWRWNSTHQRQDEMDVVFESMPDQLQKKILTAVLQQ